MDPRRWWLLAGAVVAQAGCLAAASSADLRRLGDLAVASSGVVIAVVVWRAAGRTGRSRTSWRLLALATMAPVLGVALAAVVAPAEPLDEALLRWTPTVPGYLLAAAAMLGLVGRRRLRAAGRRLAVEAALFSSACLVVVHYLVLGPVGGWAHLQLREQLVLAAAVAITSVTMAAALVLLGTVEVRRQPMALVLLLAGSCLTVGRALGTAAVMGGTPLTGDTSRFFVCAGLWLLALAAVTDPGRSDDSGSSAALGRTTALGDALPHLAMLVAVGVTGAVALGGTMPGSPNVAGCVLCVALAVLHRWITIGEARVMAARLRRQEAYFRSLVFSSSDAVLILDERLAVTTATTALERVLGPGAAELVGRPLLEAVHPEDRADLGEALRSVPTAEAAGATGTAPGLFTLRLRDGEGSWHTFEAGITDLRADADVGGVVLHCRDMTERHAREQALLGIAYTDPMTGLPNRAGFFSVLEANLPSTAVGGPASVLLIELDGLAAARDRIGRDAVSRVVAEVGRRLRATVRAEDVVARMGGGAFAVLGSGTAGEIDRLAARCLAVVEQPVVTEGGIVDLTAGIGVAGIEDESVESLLHRLELAVRAAHEAGPGTARRYESALGGAADRRAVLQAALQRARADGQLSLVFEPIVALGEQRITGLDAQLRWRHPELGEVPPEEFLPLAEHTGLIGEVMRWALQEVATVTAELPPVGGSLLKIGLTVPGGYVATGTLVPDVEHALRAGGLPHDRLVLQLSSAAVAAADERTGLDVASLRLMGVHVALDGFGGSESALGHLTRLPIDIVRLDRALIRRVDRDRMSRALCESIISIGRVLGLDVVADGVETPAQLTTLLGVGCTFAQGIPLGRPVPAAGLLAFLGSDASAERRPVGSR